MVTSRKKKKESKSDAANDEVLLKESIDSVDNWFKYSNDHIQRARDYLTFLYVDQWDMDVRKAREAVSRPCMQFNKLTTIIRSILGEQRENSPALTVRGVGKNIQQEQVTLREGMLRQIHYDSDADIVYQIASKHAMECGWGAVRVCTKYENEDSFEQVPYIEPIVDLQCAFWDPTSQLPDKSDGDYCGVYTTISKDHFERIYPDIENPQSVDTTGAYYFNWYTIDTITMCERYYKEYYTKTIVQLSDGNTVEKKEAEEILERQEAYLASNPDAFMMGFKPLEIVNEREAQDYKIKYVKFIKNKILEKKDYPGRLLPVVYFEGDSVVIDGERIPIPYVQDAIDNQKLINYLGSELAYAVVRARKETIIGTAENFEGYEQDWRNSDQVQGPLNFNYDSKGGRPEFIKPPVFNEQLVDLYNNTVNDLQQNIGWYDEAKGDQTNAISGKAINARQSASKNPVKVYNDNWQRGIKQVGKVILDLFPHLYDTERTVMMRGKDNSTKAVVINQQQGFRLGEGGNIEANVANDMSYGKYDIEVQVGGSYDTQMAQAMDTLINLSKVNPGIGNLIPDMIAEVSGLENSEKLTARLKTLLPPQILAEEEGKPMPPPEPPQVDPMIEIQKQKNELMLQQDQTKRQGMVLEEQKLMMQAHLAGVDQQTTYAKAAVELQKSANEKDMALLDHVTRVNESHSKEIQSKNQRGKNERKRRAS